MNILHVNTWDGPGGAAALCSALDRSLQAQGHNSTVAVGRKVGNDPAVWPIEHDRHRTFWGRFWMALARRTGRYSGRIRGAQRIADRWLPRVACPKRFWDWIAGREDFNFPGTASLVQQTPCKPDVLHLHNLHGDYFDLTELPRLTRSLHTVITLHDAWLLSGHCAHSFDCERWKTGCGRCPDLTIPPALRRDGTAFNWRRKARIYQSSRLHVVCPSRWLAERVRQSMLLPAATHLEVIFNGVDTTVFKPGDKLRAREQLGWPRNEFILMFAGNTIRQSVWKDYATMRWAVARVAEMNPDARIRFIAVGEQAAPERIGSARVEFLPYRQTLTECYQAADVYVHAARAEVWGLVITEALACGCPVVATAVGGIPEQLKEAETGFLTPPGDAESMARSINELVRNPGLRERMGREAACAAQQTFSLDRMVASYLALYRSAMGGE